MRGRVALEGDLSGEDVCVIRKSYDGQEVLLAFNISAEAQTVDLSGISLEGADAELQIGSVLLTSAEATATLEDGTLTMPAYSVTIIE